MAALSVMGYCIATTDGMPPASSAAATPPNGFTSPREPVVAVLHALRKTSCGAARSSSTRN